MDKHRFRIVPRQPYQFVIRFARPDPANDLGEEKRTALAVMDLIVRGEEQLVCDANPIMQHNPKATFFFDLSDGGGLWSLHVGVQPLGCDQRRKPIL